MSEIIILKKYDLDITKKRQWRKQQDVLTARMHSA